MVDQTPQNENKHSDSWLNTFVRFNKIPFLAIVFIMLVGMIAVVRIPKESAPQIDFGTILINTSFPGASAVDVDQLVTQEIEQEIKDVEGVDEVNSTSRSSFSSITVQLDPSADTNAVLNDIRSKVDQAKGDFPEDAEDPLIESLTGGQEPIFVVRLVGNLDDMTLRDQAERLKLFLENDASVKEVNISGGAEREIIVDLDPQRLQQFEVNAQEVVNAIRQSHTDSPIGELDLKDTEYNLRIKGRHQTAQDIQAVVIKNLESGGVFTPLTVAQLGRVQERAEKTDGLQRFIDVENNLPARSAISLSITKKKNVDIFRIDPIIREKTLDFVERNFASNLQPYFTLELVDEVKDSYGTVIISAIQAILMVVVLLFLFLRSRESLIASMVIPLSFLTTITVTFARGDTLNFMVNFSMVLALGILVDVSIVIVEGIYEELRKGASPQQAALNALHEFKNPLISGTLTTLAVFVPLLGLPDVLGKFLSFIPLSVSITLIAALAIALLIIPGVSSVVLKETKSDAPPSRLERFYLKRDQYVQRVSKRYGSLISRALQSRWYRIGGFYLVIVLCLLSFLFPVPFTLFPSDDFNLMRVNVELAEGKTKESTLAAALPVESIINDLPEVQYLITEVSQNNATILIEFFPKELREQRGLRTSLEIADELRKAFLAFTDYEVRISEETFGPPSEAAVAFRVITQDASQLEQTQQVVEDFKRILEGIPNTENVRDNATSLPGEIVYSINNDAATRLEVDRGTASTASRAAVEGVIAATITRGNREVDVRVQYDQEQVSSFGDVSRLQLLNRSGEAISFGQIVEANFGSALSEIKRVDRQIAITVSSDLTRDGNALDVTNAFLAEVAQQELPEGITFVDAGENAENADLFFALAAGFMIAIILIFSILVIQFNSFGLPGIIVFTIVMSLMGVNFGMWITGIPRSLAFIIGVISLAGIVVNDAIVLVDRINILRREHPERPLEAVIQQAGVSRFQPIILTTLTTAAGAFPLLFVDSFWAGLSVTIIFGLVVASSLTLFVTPAMYYQISKEAGLTYLPLLILIGVLLLVSGLFGINPTLIIIGGLITGGLGYLWWKKFQKRTQNTPSYSSYLY